MLCPPSYTMLDSYYRFKIRPECSINTYLLVANWGRTWDQSFLKTFCKYSNEASKFIRVHSIVIITNTRDYLTSGRTFCIFDRRYSITHFVILQNAWNGFWAIWEKLASLCCVHLTASSYWTDIEKKDTCCWRWNGVAETRKVHCNRSTQKHSMQERGWAC